MRWNGTRAPEPDETFAVFEGGERWTFAQTLQQVGKASRAICMSSAYASTTTSC